MAAKKPIDPDNLETSFSVQRVLKPSGKLYPGPRRGPRGDWRVQLFMDSGGCMYERHRTTVYEKTVERWFAITSFEATVAEPLRRFNGGTAAYEEKRQSKAERTAEEKRRTELELRYSLSVMFGELVDELEFGITSGLWNDEAQKLFRRLIRRVADARIMFYQLNEPPPPKLPKPPKPAEFPPPVIAPTTKTIH